jgi:hypothetical protein
MSVVSDGLTRRVRGAVLALLITVGLPRCVKLYVVCLMVQTIELQDLCS